MRIAHVISYYHEGFGYQENWLAAHQIRMGHEVVVLTSDHYFPFPNYEATMAPKLGERKVGVGTFSDGEIPVIRHRSFAHSIGPPGVIFSIRKSLRQFQPDCIHLHGATNPQLFEILHVQKELGYRVFVDSHQDAKVEGVKKTYLAWRLLSIVAAPAAPVKSQTTRFKIPTHYPRRPGLDAGKSGL